MGLRNLFRRKRKQEKEAGEDHGIDQGVHYLYVIIALQILLVFGLLAGIMVIGKVLATPLWVFIAMGIGAVWGCIHIYRKIKQKFKKLHQALTQVDLSNKNYQISVMGGALTMRVEQNSRPLLESPQNPPVVDAETVEAIEPTVETIEPVNR